MSHAAMHEIVVLDNETCSIYRLIIQQSQNTCEAFYHLFHGAVHRWDRFSFQI